MKNIVAIVNASQWHSTQSNGKYFYSPRRTFMNTMQKHCNLSAFFQKTYKPFAGIIYDSTRQTILAVRDHFGLEPCYYSYTNGRFIFGSRIPDLLKHLPSPFALNTEQINQLLIEKWIGREAYSDETYYQLIHRVEPGCELHFDLSTQASPIKMPFWDLKQYDQTIDYSDKRDYVAHFSELLGEAIGLHCGSKTNIAIEFSGGLDSSAIVTAAFQKNIDLTLYTHIATPNSYATDDMPQVKHLIRSLGIKNIHYVDAQQFDFIASMNEYAQYFAGAAPYNGFVLASNIHHAIAKQRHLLVLSGIGGDECVSSHAPLNAYLPQVLRERGKKAVWRELNQNHPNTRQTLPQQINTSLRWLKYAMTKPNGSLREHEYNLLQGLGSHHLRLRIEYNAIVAKSLGFDYVYPLLYPPLVEFCHQLPLEQKRRNRVNRCLIRDYLAQFFSSDLYGKQSKSGSVTPATLEKVRTLFIAGHYDTLFEHLPFKRERDQVYMKNKTNKYYPFMHGIPAYMFKTYWDGLSSAHKPFDNEYYRDLP